MTSPSNPGNPNPNPVQYRINVPEDVAGNFENFPGVRELPPSLRDNLLRAVFLMGMGLLVRAQSLDGFYRAVRRYVEEGEIGDN